MSRGPLSLSLTPRTRSANSSSSGSAISGRKVLVAKESPRGKPCYWCSTCQRSTTGDLCGRCGMGTVYVSPEKLASLERIIYGSASREG